MNITETIKKAIKDIDVNRANFEHIAKTGNINGSLSISIEKAITQILSSKFNEKGEIVEEPENYERWLMYPHLQVTFDNHGFCLEYQQAKTLTEWIEEAKIQKGMAKAKYFDANQVRQKYSMASAELQTVRTELEKLQQELTEYKYKYGEL